MVSTRRRGGVRRAVALCAATILTLATSCGGDEPDEDESSSTTTTQTRDTTAPATTPLTPEEEVEAVYLELVDTVTRLVTTNPDPEDADLAKLATDPLLGTFRDNLSTMATENFIVRPGPRTSHRVMSVSLQEPSVAVLRDCSVGNDTTVDRDDGKVIDEGLSTRVLEATVISIDGQWMVSSIATVEKSDGEVTCHE